MTTTKQKSQPDSDELSEQDLDTVSAGTHELTHVVQQGGPKAATGGTNFQANESDLTFLRR